MKMLCTIDPSLFFSQQLITSYTVPSLSAESDSTGGLCAAMLLTNAAQAQSGEDSLYY